MAPTGREDVIDFVDEAWKMFRLYMGNIQRVNDRKMLSTVTCTTFMAHWDIVVLDFKLNF